MNTLPFNKHPNFVVRSESPFNGGPPTRLIHQSPVTPLELFFVRNHGEVPEVDVNAYRLDVAGQGVAQPVSFSLADLQSRFERVSVPATLQCAGNRRAELCAFEPIPHELEWGVEAIGHAVWAGVRLGDVLSASGVERGAGLPLHVEFEGLDETERLGKRFHFGGSIPVEKAFADEVILAYEMNGAPLTPVHGAPLRVVVPGYIGARSVKWLKRITVMPEPSYNYFQRHAYRLFEPHVHADSVQWDEGVMLGEMNVTSVICSHVHGETIRAGQTFVTGFAITGGGRAVTQVEFSPNGGETWLKATLAHTEDWSWCFWSVAIELKPGTHHFIVRAADSAGNMQPEAIAQVWNFKGYMNNAWHGVQVNVEEI